MSFDLSKNLNSKDSFAERDGIVDSLTFDSQNDRSAISSTFIKDASITNAKIGTAVIGTANIGTLSFNEISGGTAILGGTLNQSGKLIVKSQSGTVIGSFSKDGIIFQDATGIVRLISPTDDDIYVRSLIIGGTIQPALGTPDGAIDIWQSGGLRYFTVNVDEGLRIDRKMVELNGTNTPNAGTGNSCQLYLDTSAGKTRLMALFESGVAQVVATEP